MPTLKSNTTAVNTNTVANTVNADLIQQALNMYSEEELARLRESSAAAMRIHREWRIDEKEKFLPQVWAVIGNPHLQNYDATRKPFLKAVKNTRTDEFFLVAVLYLTNGGTIEIDLPKNKMLKAHLEEGDQFDPASVRICIERFNMEQHICVIGEVSND